MNASPAKPRIVFATNNANKVGEVRAILEPEGFDVVGLDAFSLAISEPAEDADTFAGNARIKATIYAATLGETCLADDSGLCVDALDGRPGVHSARYAGLGDDREHRDAANNEKLLREMAGVPDEQRSARFECAMCLATPDGRILAETRGTFEGGIGHAPHGNGGFGYDPLLVLEDGRSAAELTPTEKNRRSHRGVAVRAMAETLRAGVR
ncbi:MAG: RdgB/HAM1 family non-canonical purine NTP pyrophosphatase [Phycisphaerales bacterium]